MRARSAVGLFPFGGKTKRQKAKTKRQKAKRENEKTKGQKQKTKGKKQKGGEALFYLHVKNYPIKALF